MRTIDRTIEPLRTARLVLTPLVPADAAEMVEVLADQSLYAFIGGEPPEPAALARQYEAQVAGPDREGETWHNWIVRLDGIATGFVQATVIDGIAEIAWVIGVPWQRRGIATEAAGAMKEWLATIGVTRFEAHIHPAHAASAGVAAALGLAPTGTLDDDGEMVWSTG